jgi:hypothetical protein
MKFNVNDEVKVRLTDYGRKLLRRQHDELYSRYGLHDTGYIEPTQDADGYKDRLEVLGDWEDEEGEGLAT